MAAWLAVSFRSGVILVRQPSEKICEGGAAQHAKLRSIEGALHVCHVCSSTATLRWTMGAACAVHCNQLHVQQLQ